jgi:hypothetical protein
VKKEMAMLNKIVTLAVVAVLAALLMPSRVGAWGAAHVGVTRVGPYGGVHHAGRTVAAGPGGVYSSGHVGGVGPGGAYRAGYAGGAGYGGAYRAGYAGAAGWGGYRAGAGYRYGYIR